MTMSPRPKPPPVPRAAPAVPAESWGRVAEDGTVYVRTRDGERVVGQWPGADPDEALRLFAQRFAGLALDVQLLEQRVASRALEPNEAGAAVGQLRQGLTDAKAVGDFDRLAARLDALSVTIEEQRLQRKAEKARRVEEAATEKQQIVTEAERIGASSDWRGGLSRLDELLTRWKGLPRLERHRDDELWRRFSAARTSYTRRRKTHFSELHEQQETARSAKERLVVKAEALAGSTEWGATGSAFRELMRQWKAAGPASRAVDDQLWWRFRAAQDTFFGARDAVSKAADAELTANAEKKRALLPEAEALVPVTDAAAAKSVFRSVAERWDSIGKVPATEAHELEGRLRAVEQAIRGVEEERWRRRNPEAHARAADTVAQLEESISALRRKHDAAMATGDSRVAGETAAAIEAREAWLLQARKVLDDSG